KVEKHPAPVVPRHDGIREVEQQRKNLIKLPGGRRAHLRHERSTPGDLLPIRVKSVGREQDFGGDLEMLEARTAVLANALLDCCGLFGVPKGHTGDDDLSCERM